MSSAGLQTAAGKLLETPKPAVPEWKRKYRKFVKNPIGIIGLVMVLLITFISIAAPLLTSHDPIEVNLEEKLQPMRSGRRAARGSTGWERMRSGAMYGLASCTVRAYRCRSDFLPS